MDANGLRFYALSNEPDWAIPVGSAVYYDRAARVLRLSSSAALSFEEPEADPLELLAQPPQALDEFGTYAFCDAAAERIFAAGATDGQTEIAAFAGAAISDIALGRDGILYACVDAQLTFIDTRNRWAPERLAHAGLAAFRLAALERGVLILDRGARRLWIASGRPFPQAHLHRARGDVFRPEPENPDPPRVRPLLELPEAEEPVAIAADSSGAVVVLSWLTAPRRACVRRVETNGRMGPRWLLQNVARPFSIGWLDRERIVVLVQTTQGTLPVPYLLPSPAAESEAATTPEDEELPPLGGVYPLVRYGAGPFVHALHEPVHYPSAADSGTTLPTRPRPLVQLSVPELQRSGRAEPAAIDSQRAGTVWHRLYIEATLPAQCAALVQLAASESPETPPDNAFFDHVFGELPAGPGVPHGVWSSQASELPFHPGLVCCASQPHRSGLFGVLIQRAGRSVTALSGRYLHVRVTLMGNGRATPEIAGLRAYASRFSYVSEYLPRLYREQLFAPEADLPAARTTPADFLERFLCTFESVLTPLEDRIAHAHLLSDPETTPEDALEWLGSWVGLVFDPAYPVQQRRRAVKQASELHRWHGTLRGLRLALDILLDDACQRGEAIVVEDFRLRRTFATILGADLADEFDPLTAGIVASGNSFVGDTLVLGDEWQREFLAVFRATLPEQPRSGSLADFISYFMQRYVDPHEIAAFFDRFAHRLTVLVPKETGEDRIALIRRIVELEAPAYLRTQVTRATQPFIVGLASLVGIDTFVREPAPPPPTRVDLSRVGTSFLSRPASLDPRLEVEA